MQLMELAPEIVAIILRLAIFADHRSSKIEPSTERWAAVVSGIDSAKMQNAIDKFHAEQVSSIFVCVLTTATEINR